MLSSREHVIVTSEDVCFRSKAHLVVLVVLALV